jgi:hypothetical protein
VSNVAKLQKCTKNFKVQTHQTTRYLLVIPNKPKDPYQKKKAKGLVSHACNIQLNAFFRDFNHHWDKTFTLSTSAAIEMFLRAKSSLFLSFQLYQQGNN